MKATNQTMLAVTTTRILIGLVMLVPGLLKLFVMKPSAVVGMLSNNVLFSWAPGFWAWVLILSEIIFGIAIIANYKLRLTTIPPIIIMLVATFTSVMRWNAISTTNWSGLLMHLSLAGMYWIYGAYDNE